MTNIYDIKQIILNENISNFSNLTYYEMIKCDIKKLKNNLNGVDGDNGINKLIDELFSLIKPARSLLNQQRDVENNFFFLNTNKNHEIFKPLWANLEKVNLKIKEFKQIKQFEKYGQLESFEIQYNSLHLSFIDELVSCVNSKKPNCTPSVNLLKTLPLVISEDLIIKEIESLKLSYEMVSYDDVNHEYKRQEDSTSHSIGSFSNNCYLKVDNGLLKPSKEYAIYQFYKSLFQQSDHALISPTQLLVLSNLEILSPDINQSNVRKELIQLKLKYNTTSTEEVLKHQPDFRAKLENALSPVREIFVQASLKSNGKTLEQFLESENDYSKLDFESFSSHIISSLLVITTDYKSDNLIVEDDTGRIIGIDNDEALEFNEFKKKIGTFVKIKNVLYTLKPLMNKPVHDNVRNQIIQQNPNLFILKWLKLIEIKQSNYESLVSLLLNLHDNSSIDENQINKAKENILNSLGIPLQFKKGWINLMVSRFKLIIKLLLKDNGTTTHQDLFLNIHPYASLYYESLSKEHDHPLDQIASIYRYEFSFEELFEKYPPTKCQRKILNQLCFETNQIDNPIPIKESMKELILVTDYCDLSDSPVSLIEFIGLVLSDVNIGDFNQSWYDSKLLILNTLIQNGTEIIMIDSIIKHFNITKSEIEKYCTSILHTTILSNNINVIKQIEYLIKKFNLDFEKIENNNNSTPLDLSFGLKSININLVCKLIDLGAGKLSNPSLFCKFYKRLSNEEKLSFKPSLDKLFLVNPKINWEISLNQLLPLSENNIENNVEGIKYLSEVIGNGNRLISDEYWNQLFNSNGTIKKLNEYGTRSVTLIQDEFGNGIYFKFEPQFPGTELAVIGLSELLFGYLSPYCELVSINNFPVLLIQQIPGKTLFDILDNDPKLINSINDSSNISKQLVMSMLSNNGDGNLGNFIIHENKIYSIDNDQSFMPPITKQIGQPILGKKSLQVETVLLLFKQMNDPVHKDVFDYIIGLDIYQVLKQWLKNLEYHHQVSLVHFKLNRKELKSRRQTIIGVSFTNSMIEHLLSKLLRLQQELIKCKKTGKSITHFQLLEILEPLVSNRYKQVNSDNIELSIIEKYSKLRNNSKILFSSKLFTCSTHPTSQLLESRDIPNAKDIQDELWSGKYSPTYALNELILYESKQSILENLYKNNTDHISNFKLESVLKSLKKFNSNLDNDKFKSIINAIKPRELKCIHFKNSPHIDLNSLKQIKIDSIVNLDLSGSSSLTQFDFGSIVITATIFKSLISLKLNNCQNLITIKLIAPNLKVLRLSNCKQLSNLNVDSPGLIKLNLKATTSLCIRNLREQFRQLEDLDLSERLFDKETISFGNLKILNLNSNINLKQVYFKLPNIESIDFENCNQELMVNLINRDQNHRRLVKIINDRFKINNYRNEFLSFHREKLKTAEIQ